MGNHFCLGPLGVRRARAGSEHTSSLPAGQGQHCPPCCPVSPSSPPPCLPSPLWVTVLLASGSHQCLSEVPGKRRGVTKVFPDWGQAGMCWQAALAPGPGPPHLGPAQSYQPTGSTTPNTPWAWRRSLPTTHNSWLRIGGRGRGPGGGNGAGKWDLTGAGHLGQRM